MRGTPVPAAHAASPRSPRACSAAARRGRSWCARRRSRSRPGGRAWSGRGTRGSRHPAPRTERRRGCRPAPATRRAARRAPQGSAMPHHIVTSRAAGGCASRSRIASGRASTNSSICDGVRNTSCCSNWMPVNTCMPGPTPGCGPSSGGRGARSGLDPRSALDSSTGAGPTSGVGPMKGVDVATTKFFGAAMASAAGPSATKVRIAVTSNSNFCVLRLAKTPADPSPERTVSQGQP